MDQKVFEQFQQLVYEKSGISLGPQKVALVTARVGKRIRALNISDHEEYLAYVKRDEKGDELVQLLDAISTNVTSFFREAAHFDILAELLADWRKRGQTQFRIWCAASSTGEEPYCLAMTAMEAFQGASVDLRILATDISTRVLDIARKGQYNASKLETVPKQLLDKYFHPPARGGEPVYTVKPELRRLISFNRLNLSTPPFPMKGPMDAVFCRNVMIYFDNVVRTRLVKEIHRLLRPDGYLMVGHSESLTGIDVPFKTMKPAVYKKG